MGGMTAQLLHQPVAVAPRGDAGVAGRRRGHHGAVAEVGWRQWWGVGRGSLGDQGQRQRKGRQQVAGATAARAGKGMRTRHGLLTPIQETVGPALQRAQRRGRRRTTRGRQPPRAAQCGRAAAGRARLGGAQPRGGLKMPSGDTAALGPDGVATRPLAAGNGSSWVTYTGPASAAWHRSQALQLEAGAAVSVTSAPSAMLTASAAPLVLAASAATV